MNRRIAKLWLCAPFAVVGLIDATVTLYGQSSEYWRGDSSALSEGFPLFARALYHSPLAFTAVFVIWVVIFCAAIVLLPDLFSEILTVALINGHTWGTMTWLVYDLQVRYESTLVVFLCTAILFVSCDRMWRRSLASATAKTP